MSPFTSLLAACHRCRRLYIPPILLAPLAPRVVYFLNTLHLSSSLSTHAARAHPSTLPPHTHHQAPSPSTTPTHPPTPLTSPPHNGLALLLHHQHGPNHQPLQRLPHHLPPRPHSHDIRRPRPLHTHLAIRRLPSTHRLLRDDFRATHARLSLRVITAFLKRE